MDEWGFGRVLFVGTAAFVGGLALGYAILLPPILWWVGLP